MDHPPESEPGFDLGTAEPPAQQQGGFKVHRRKGQQLYAPKPAGQGQASCPLSTGMERAERTQASFPRQLSLTAAAAAA